MQSVAMHGKLLGRISRARAFNYQGWAIVSDIDYFRKRLAEELALAASSSAQEVRSVHEHLAELYADRLVKLGAETGRILPFVQRTDVCEAVTVYGTALTL